MSKLKTESQATLLPEYHIAIAQRQLICPASWLYYKDEYHLYYMYRNLGSSEGTNSWGHIQSRDLISWSQAPDVALVASEGRLYSGSILLDSKNTSGLGTISKPPLIAVFTLEQNGHQALHLRYSLDGGLLWIQQSKNPVLDPKKPEFRDPHIFWHEPTSKWIMTVCVPLEFKVQFYSSKNLLKWDLMNDFGGHPSFKNKWSQVSLVPTSVINQQNVYKWVLMVNTEEQFSSGRYFVGDFDGKSFRCDHALDLVLPLDYGKDFMGFKPCSSAPDHRLLLMGCLSNTAYVDSLPFNGWKGMFSLPREIGLVKILDGSFKLVQKPVPELHNLGLRTKEITKSNFTNELEWDLELSEAMLFELKIDSHKGCTLEFDFGSKCKLLLNWDTIRHQICFDRTSKVFAFHPLFNSFDCAPVGMGHSTTFIIYLDKYSMEIFTDDGRVVLTSIFIPPHPLQRFRIIGKQFAASGTVSSLNA